MQLVCVGVSGTTGTEKTKGSRIVDTFLSGIVEGI
jgi:hypothetical protein